MPLVRRAYSIWALLMLCSYLFIFTVRCVHTHGASYTAPREADQEIGKSSILELALSCDICEYFLHKQSQQCLPEQQLEIVRDKTPGIQTIPPFHAGISTLSFFAWTNKGPPQA